MAYSKAAIELFTRACCVPSDMEFVDAEKNLNTDEWLVRWERNGLDYSVRLTGQELSVARSTLGMESPQFIFGNGF